MSTRTRPPGTTSAPARRTIGMGAGMVAAPTGIGYLQPTLGAALAIAETAIIAIIGVTLLAAILRGTPETNERVFRLLRMLTNRTEPPSPGQQ